MSVCYLTEKERVEKVQGSYEKKKPNKMRLVGFFEVRSVFLDLCCDFVFVFFSFQFRPGELVLRDFVLRFQSGCNICWNC